ncbi:MAG: hypothetical protein IRZ08_17510, partial [Frankia sp.]|nr:hypothetical protein [Frankia sp.]
MPGEPAPVVRRRVPLGEFSRPGRPARRTGGRRTWLVAVTLSVAVGAAAGLGIGVVLRSAQDEAGGGAGPAAPPRAGTAA